MATPLGLSRDDVTRIFQLCQKAWTGTHARTTIGFNGKRLRVVVYEERDVQAIYQERAQASQ